MQVNFEIFSQQLHLGKRRLLLLWENSDGFPGKQDYPGPVSLIKLGGLELKYDNKCKTWT